MNGYVYITGQGADPGSGRYLKDPMFGPVPTLGACMPNIRRAVSIGDWIFVVSGKIERFQQYIIGGMQVAEKISALEAHARFPNNRLALNPDGLLVGNVVISADGNKHPLDTHSNDGFDRRVENFIVGGRSISLDMPGQVQRSRNETLPILQQVAGKAGNRPIDVIGRMSKIDEPKVDAMLAWLNDVKSGK
ncbi:hypothetical protein NKJ86_00365 [Mesorhizobium sp. M0025]|uniref:Nmad2 family putative nucleotide modification protein n=1 Tax=Mesorhizobium sp. M0025 TaxID=2956846 RepID=UPI00333D574E